VAKDSASARVLKVRDPSSFDRSKESHLLADVELRLAHLAPLGGDEDDAVGGLGTVDRGGASALEHLDLLDVLRVDVRDAVDRVVLVLRVAARLRCGHRVGAVGDGHVAYHDAVHHVQRLQVTDDGGHAAEVDLNATAGGAGVGRDRRARNLALQRALDRRVGARVSSAALTVETALARLRCSTPVACPVITISSSLNTSGSSATLSVSCSGGTVTCWRLYPMARTTSVVGPPGALRVNRPSLPACATIWVPRTAIVASDSPCSVCAFVMRPAIWRSWGLPGADAQEEEEERDDAVHALCHGASERNAGKDSNEALQCSGLAGSARCRMRAQHQGDSLSPSASQAVRPATIVARQAFGRRWYSH